MLNYSKNKSVNFEKYLLKILMNKATTAAAAISAADNDDSDNNIKYKFVREISNEISQLSMDEDIYIHKKLVGLILSTVKHSIEYVQPINDYKTQKDIHPNLGLNLSALEKQYFENFLINKNNNNSEKIFYEICLRNKIHPDRNYRKFCVYF